MTDNEKNEVTPKEEAKAADAKKNGAKAKKTPIKERLSKFFREYKSEFKKIVWYGKQQTFNSSVLVIVSLVISGVAIGALDLVFSKLLNLLGSLI